MSVLDLSAGKRFSTQDFDVHMNNHLSECNKTIECLHPERYSFTVNVHTTLRFRSITNLHNLFERYLKSITNVPKKIRKSVSSKDC